MIKILIGGDLYLKDNHEIYDNLNLFKKNLQNMFHTLDWQLLHIYQCH